MAGKKPAIDPKVRYSKGKTSSPATSNSWIPWFLLWALVFLVLAAVIVSVAYVLTNPQGECEDASYSQPAPTATPISPPIAAAVSEPLQGEDGLAYLRVEVQVPTNFPRGYWGPLPKVGIFLSPYLDGDKVPDPDRKGTVRQVVELKKTKDNSLVAVTTFSVPPGIYWVGVNHLPSGCSVWVPRFVDDPAEMTQVSWGPPSILDQPDVLYIWKFQVVCGLRVLPTSSPVVPTKPTEPPPGTPTPTSPPPPLPTPTAPPPSPTPTDSCGPDCEEPWTPVPTPTAYPPDVSTPTPVR